MEKVVIPEPVSTIPLVKAYIDKANSFLRGPSKLLVDLKDVFEAFDTFGTYDFSIGKNMNIGNYLIV